MSEVLPPLYQKWFDALLPGPLPSETRATCGDCAMAKEPPEAAFHPRVKCCSFSPELANFLVGRILGDAATEGPAARGRLVMHKQVAAKLEVSPLGVRPAPAYAVLYDAAMKTGEVFGRTPPLRCQFYVDEGGGLCGIHAHRNSVCTTWFCKFERGARGATLWNQVRVLLGVLEEALRWWCVLETGLGDDAVRALWTAERNRKGPVLDVPAVAGQPDLHRHKRLWGTWAGREVDWFIACARAVETLTLDDALAIGGAPARAMAKVLRDGFSMLEGPLEQPARAVRGPALVQLGRRADVAQAKSALAPHDPLEVPLAVAAALPRLVGQPLDQALAAVRADGVPLDDAMLARLLDYQVLLPG